MPSHNAKQNTFNKLGSLNIFLLLLGLACIVIALVNIGYSYFSTSSIRNTAPTKHHQAQLLADHGGPLAVVVTAVNSARRSALRNADLISNIVTALPTSTKVFILSNDRQAFTIENNKQRYDVEFIDIPTDNPITIWPQDPFLVLQDNKGSIKLLKSKQFSRAGDDYMANAIANKLEIPIINSALTFEGGNIVADNDYIYIGANTIAMNAEALGINEVAVVELFQNELGREVVVIGPVPQPIPHIDMMLTPLGNKKIVVADSRLAADIVATTLENNPERISTFERDTEANFFGHPAIETIQLDDDTQLQPPNLQGKTQDAIQAGREMADYFDDIAISLAQRGLKVVRMPFLQTSSFTRDIQQQATERPYKETLDYPVLTYNNIISVNQPDTQQVYLPQYGLKALDNAAVEAWQNAGYVVIKVPGFINSALYGGALRCAVKVLRRH